MRALIWRAALIAILLITLIGSIIVLFQDQSAASWLAVAGTVASIMQAVIATGLDVASRRQPPDPGTMVPPNLDAFPQSKHAAAPPSRPRTRFDFAALIQAATVGALLSGAIGLLRGIPKSDVLLFCPHYAIFVMTGVAYTLFARSHLPRDAFVNPLHGMMGGVAVGMIASIVGSVARSVSVWAIFPAGVENASAALGLTPTDEATWILLGMCMVLALGTLFSGIGGLVTALLTRRHLAQGTR